MIWANGQGNILATDMDRQDFRKTPVAACGGTGFPVNV